MCSRPALTSVPWSSATDSIPGPGGFPRGCPARPHPPVAPVDITVERQPVDTEDMTDDVIADVTPELDPAAFDLDAWISGATPTVRAVTLYQRPDLLGEIDALQRQLRIAEQVGDDDRGMNDASPDGIRGQLEQVARDFEASALTFKVQGRSDEARDRIKKRLKKQGVTDEETVVLHQLADAVIEPAGVTPEQLRRLQEASEPQLKMLLTAASLAHYQPPAVDVPFSSGSSRGRKREGRS